METNQEVIDQLIQELEHIESEDIEIHKFINGILQDKTDGINIDRRSFSQLKGQLRKNGTRREMAGYIKKRFGLLEEEPKHHGEFSKVTSNDGSVAYMIYIEHFNWRIPEYGLLAHEVMHCVYRVLDDLGLLLADSSVEAYCYYYQKIFQECVFGIKEKLKNKKRMKQRGRS